MKRGKMKSLENLIYGIFTLNTRRKQERIKTFLMF